MVEISANPLPKVIPRPVLKSTPLRKIIFIADIMWEANELVPELEILCPVEVLDLRPALRTGAGQGASEPEIVARVVRDFSKTQREMEPDLVLFYARTGVGLWLQFRSGSDGLDSRGVRRILFDHR